jgi:hypothetical protein
MVRELDRYQQEIEKRKLQIADLEKQIQARVASIWNS